MSRTFESMYYDSINSDRTPSDIIWWERIGKSIRTIRDIKHLLVNQESFVFSAPQGIPWENTFEKVVKREVSTISSERMLRFIAPGDQDPDRYCLSELCSDSFESAYWPSMTRATYICSDRDLLFHRYYIWVKGIQEAKVFRKWVNFITEYRREAQKACLPLTAVFILEQNKGKIAVSGLSALKYIVSDSDCRIFGMEKLQEVTFSDSDSISPDSVLPFTEYLAEMAVQISNSDPELCDMLLEVPNDLLMKPVETAEGFLDSKGIMVDLHMIESAIWKAQIIHFFPLLEQYRLELIKQHEDEINPHLPINDIYGEVIKDPEEMEFRHLISFSHQGYLSLSAEEKGNLKLCRNVRNSISHNNILYNESIVSLYSLYAKIHTS